VLRSHFRLVLRELCKRGGAVLKRAVNVGVPFGVGC
jgi:hypothetical protein